MRYPVPVALLVIAAVFLGGCTGTAPKDTTSALPAGRQADALLALHGVDSLGESSKALLTTERTVDYSEIGSQTRVQSSPRCRSDPATAPGAKTGPYQRQNIRGSALSAPVSTIKNFTDANGMIAIVRARPSSVIPTIHIPDDI
jgi:hypothetical protein